MRNLILSVLALLAYLPSAQAAIFDAADILPQNSGAVGAFGEILLSDPTSEGVEARGRYGLSDAWNVGASLGVGSKYKKLRLGGEGVYNLLPDWEGQVGVSFLGSAIFLQRPGSGGIQMRIAPMVHKRVTSWSGYPATLYAALPFQVEARGGTYTTGTQLVLGADWDISNAGQYYVSTETGIRLAQTDSYVLVGMGVRLGNLRFNKRDRSQEKGKRENGAAKDKELTDEDFQK